MTTLAVRPAGTGAGTPLRARLNISPMGPIVDGSFERFVFRPFKSSTTYQNLKAHGEGIFHVTDDALLIARAAIGSLASKHLPVRPGRHVDGLVLTNACRCYELRVTKLDDQEDRTRIETEVLGVEQLRPFFGFNRARHAVLEAAILATRVFLTGKDAVLTEYDRLQVLVDKTGSRHEHEAMADLRKHVEAQ